MHSTEDGCESVKEEEEKLPNKNLSGFMLAGLRICVCVCVCGGGGCDEQAGNTILGTI